MKFALAVFAVAGLANVAAAEPVIDVNRVTCATFAVYQSEPEAFGPTVGSFIDGMLTGLTAAGYGDRPALFERLGEVCWNDPRLSMISAVRTMIQN